MHEVLVNRLGGLSLPRKSVVRLTDRPDMTLDVYCGRKTTLQQGPSRCYRRFRTFGLNSLADLQVFFSGSSVFFHFLDIVKYY